MQAERATDIARLQRVASIITEFRQDPGPFGNTPHRNWSFRWRPFEVTGTHDRPTVSNQIELGTDGDHFYLKSYPVSVHTLVGVIYEMPGHSVGEFIHNIIPQSLTGGEQPSLTALRKKVQAVNNLTPKQLTGSSS